MIIPIVHSPATADRPDPAVDLKVAIKLLSGTDCERDASQAQVLLLRLAEGSSGVIQEDAARIVKAGSNNGWFADKTPPQYELERIAERSLAQNKGAADKQRLMIVYAAGVATLVAGILAYLIVQGDGQIDFASLPLIVLALIVLGLVFAFKARRNA